MNNEREKSQELLSFYARAVSGFGLIIPKVMADDLRAMGITGPFYERPPFPLLFDGPSEFRP